MAANVVEILVRAKDQASQEIKGITAAIEQNAAKFRQAGLVISAAGAAITGAMGLALKAAADAEKAWAGVSLLVENAGLSVEESIPRIKEFASAMQDATGESGEMVAEMVGKLLPATKDLDAAFKAVEATLDLQANGMVRGSSAARIMAQAMDGNIAVLQSYVPGLRNLTEEQLKNMTIAERQALAINAVSAAFGGKAKAQADTFAGSMKKLRENFGDLMKVIGGQLIPIARRIAEVLNDWTKRLRTLAEEHPVLTRVTILLATALGELMLVVGPMLIALPSLVAGFKLLAAAKLAVAAATTKIWLALLLMLPVILAVSAAIAALLALWHFRKQIAESETLFGILKLTNPVLLMMGDRVRNLKELWDLVTESIGKAVNAAKRFFGAQEAQAAPAAVMPVPFTGQGEVATAIPPILPTQEQMQSLLEELLTASQTGADEIRTVFEELGFQIDETMLQSAVTTRDMFRGIQDGLAEFNASLTQSLGANWDTLQGFMKNFMATTLKTFNQQMSAALSGIILGTVKAKDAFKALGEAMIKAIVDFLAQQAVALVMSKLFSGIAAKIAAVTGAAVASAWSTAAAFVSLATFGANAAPAAAGIASVVGFTKGLALTGIAELAEGGIVDKPTLAVIGEAGPEAVVPLNKVMGEQLTVNINMGDVQVRGEEDIRSLTERIVEELGFLTELRMRRPRTVG